MDIHSIASWESISQIVFNVLASLAVAAAAYKYVRLSGGPRRHTELHLSSNWLATNNSSVFIEIQIRIDNKGIELLEVFNVFLHIRSLNSGPEGWSWSAENLVSSDDEKIWLHSGTGINMTKLVEIPSHLKVVCAELVVPYKQSRLPRALNSIETAKLSDYNSLERHFVVKAPVS